MSSQPPVEGVLHGVSCDYAETPEDEPCVLNIGHAGGHQPTGKNRNRGRLIEVEWYDSERVELGWASADDYIEALNDRRVYRTAGYFIAETDAGVMISHSVSPENETFGASMVIPAQVIKRRRWLRSR